MVLVCVFRKKYQIADEREKQSYDRRRAVEDSDEESFHVDDHALAELGLLKAFDSGEPV